MEYLKLSKKILIRLIIVFFLSGFLSACSPELSSQYFSDFKAGKVLIDASSSSTLDSMNLETGQIVKRAKLSGTISNIPGFVVDKFNKTAYVQLSNGNLEAVNLDSFKIQSNLDFAKYSVGMFFDRSSNSIISVDNFSGDLLERQLNSNTTIKIPLNFSAIASSLSPNGKLLAVSGYSNPGSPGLVVLFNLDSNQKGVSLTPIAQLQIGTETVQSLVFSNNSQSLYVLNSSNGSIPAVISLINLSNPQAPRLAASVTVEFNPRVIQETDNYVITNNSFGQLQIYSASSLSLVKTIQVSATVSDISTQGNQAIITTALPSKVIELNLNTLKIVSEFSEATNYVSSYLSRSHNFVYLVAAAQNNIIQQISDTRNIARTIARSGTESFLVTGKIDQPIWLIDTDNARAILLSGSNKNKSFQICKYPQAADLSPNGSYLYVLCDITNGVGSPGLLKKISADGAAISSIETVANPVDLAISPNSKYAFILGSDANLVQEVDLNTFNISYTFNTPINPAELAVSPDSSRLYVYSTTNSMNAQLTIYDLKTNTEIKSLSVAPISQLLLSPDGSSIYLVSQVANSIKEISTATLSVMSTVSMVGNPVAASISPNGKYLFYVDDVGNYLYEYGLSSTSQPNLIAKARCLAAPTNVAVSADSAYVYCASSLTNFLYIFTTNGLSPVLTLHTKGVINQIAAQSPKKEQLFSPTTLL